MKEGDVFGSQPGGLEFLHLELLGYFGILKVPNQAIIR